MRSVLAHDLRCAPLIAHRLDIISGVRVALVLSIPHESSALLHQVEATTLWRAWTATEVRLCDERHQVAGDASRPRDASRLVLYRKP
jgi:hypothetical protein